MPREAHPFNARYILEADGRWNRPGEYGCIYTSLSKAGAIAEYQKTLAEYGLLAIEQSHRDLVRFGVWIAHVEDFSDVRTQRRAGVTTADLTESSARSFELCRSIADSMRAEGRGGIISPSAALPGAHNLTIYLDLIPAENVKLGDFEREPLNYDRPDFGT